MKTGDVAKRFHLDSNTITAWTDRFAEFFTPEALAKDKTQRDYQPEDIIVLNTIRVERIKNTKWEEIRAILDSGRREEELPAEFGAIEGTKALTLVSDLRNVNVLLANANADNERLREENTAQRKRIEDLIKDAADAERLREENTDQRKRIEELVAAAKVSEAALQKRIEELIADAAEVARLRQVDSAQQKRIDDLITESKELIRESTEWRIRYEKDKERFEAKENRRDNQ